MNHLLFTLRAEAAELSAEITRLERVSPDSAHREFYRWQALSRAVKALEEGKIFLTSPQRRVLVVGLSALPEAVLERFVRELCATKAHGNRALVALDGQRGEIRRNAADTCWIVDLASPRGSTLFAWEFSGCGLRGPRLHTTNGEGHSCGILGETARQYLVGQVRRDTVEWLDRAVALHHQTGLTPLQQDKLETERKLAASRRAGQVNSAALAAAERLGSKYGDRDWDAIWRLAATLSGGPDSTGPVPDDLADLIVVAVQTERVKAVEARIMAELEAEQARLAAERAAAEAEARRAAEVEATCTALGIAADQWTAMTDKQRRLALHRARLAGLVR